MPLATATIATPLGRYALAASARGLARAQPLEAPGAPAPDPGSAAARRVLAAARTAFAAYFAGRADAFDALPLDPTGTPFQRRVWGALREIPPGATTSYAQIARRIGRAGAARAVGAANRSNPIAIAIPCHRVIGSRGRPLGYAGGLERQRRLLELEAGGADAVRLRSAAPRCAPAKPACDQAASSTRPSGCSPLRAVARSRARADASI